MGCHLRLRREGAGQGLRVPASEAKVGCLGWNTGCLAPGFCPGQALFTLCCAQPEKKPLWREGRPGEAGPKACSVLTEGCCEENF